MSHFLRKKPRISYYETEEPNLDEYVFCSDCGDFVYEYCAIHGPLLVVPDEKVPAKSPFPLSVPRSALTIPHVFLHLAPSIIPGAGIGVFSSVTLPRGVRFGPYRGSKSAQLCSMYCWEIHDGNNKRSHYVDAEDANNSNWMRFVNCSRHWYEQNLVAYQYRGKLYYRTIKIIPKFTELMIFYGGKFARILQIDLKKYNSPKGFAQKLGAPKVKKQKPGGEKILEPTKETLPVNNKVSETPLEKNRKTNSAKENLSNNETNKVDKKGGRKSKLIKSKKVKKIRKNNLFDNEKDKSRCNNNSIEMKQLTNKTNENCYIEKSSSNFNTNKSNDNMKNDVTSVANKITCDVCGYETNKKQHLVCHLKLHKPFHKYILACNFCKYITDNQNSLKRHKIIHTGEKPYQCNVCQKTFAQTGHLRIHKMVHTGEKPYQCNVCQKTFAQTGHLRRHKMVHTGEKPYQCNVCQKTFTQTGNLKKHKRIHRRE